MSTAGERERCDTCADTGRMPWMIEGDPNCYQEPDSDGMLPCIDCSPVEPDAGDVEERLLNYIAGQAIAMNGDKEASRRELQAYVAATADRARWEGAAEAGERIAQAIERLPFNFVILAAAARIARSTP